ncbi:MAG: right-handed parallel beta-helix repeat-containing protein, partial [Candidatus Hydrogenedentes bacterium]|nr:right-handed parallel beta-helix repeat-containing protein [Candidatus Hydrogenedentota bacterium]
MYNNLQNRNIGLGACLVVAGLVLCVAPAQGAILDVCPTCAYTDLDAAFAAALPDDTIVLDGPTVPPATTYTLTTALVIDATKDRLTIRGTSQSSPELIEVEFAGGPVITVSEGFDFTAQGFTIKGGTTGILAMKGSTVDVKRCLIDGIAGIGVDCTDVATVTLESTVIANSTGEATKIDLGGFLKIVQCTFLNNGSFGVNAIAGVATVEATLIHDSDDGTNGVSGTATTLALTANWITDAAGADLALPSGVTDADAILLDPLVPAVVFDPAGFPGKLMDASQERFVPVTASLSLSLPTRDFDDTVRRAAPNVVVGADEVTGGGSGVEWTVCEVWQRGKVRRYVGEGVITIRVATPGIALNTAAIFIKHADPAIPLFTDPSPEFLGPYPIVISGLDTEFGIADVPIIEADFLAAFPSAPTIQDDYLIYIHTLGGPVSDTSNLYGLSEGTPSVPPATVGRVFGLDTQPPTIVTNFSLLADQYLAGAADGDNIAAGPPGWGAGALLGNVGANAGHLDGTAGDPQVFFDDPNVALPGFGFGISLTFVDLGSGFEITGLPTGDNYTNPVDKANALYVLYRDELGMAWWDTNSESDAELISSAVDLTVTYTNVGGNQLNTEWLFAGATHDLASQWHAIANIRVTDLAGNEATLDPSFQTFIPMKPFHMWWFPDVFPADTAARIKSGPSGAETADPRFTWGLERLGGGKDPADPFPCPPGAQWRIWRAVSPGVAGTAWVDISFGWSIWLDPVRDGTVTLDTFFDANDTMREKIQADVAGGPGSEYLLAMVGYDEAGNAQAAPAFGNLVDVTALGGIAYNRWTNPGVDMSLGLDTRIRPLFWYNNTDGGA